MTAKTASLPPAPLDVAVVQLNAQDDVDANFETIERLADRVRGVRVLALPEGCTILGDVQKKRAAAEPTPSVGEFPREGKSLRRLSALAESHSTFVFAGGVPLSSDDSSRPFNAHVVFDPAGRIVALYRKLHLFDVELADGTKLRESDSTTPGDPIATPTVVDVEGWRFGLSICYDLRFPEFYRKLVDLGAHALLVPSAFTVATGKDHWHVLLRARAIESQCYLLAPAQWGKHPSNRQTYGKSLVADPWGDVVAQVSDGPGVARTTLFPNRLADVREQLPSLKHRRL